MAVENTRTGKREVADDGGRASARRAAPVAPEAPEARFRGINWGAAFFGWLVAVGIATLLAAIVSAAGVATALTKVSPGEARDSADTIGILGGIVVLAILLLAYYAGGYVAGRMSRFDGVRQGFAAWLIGLALTVVLAVAGTILGAEYNVLGKLNLPRIPIDEGSLTTGGAITLAAIVIGTLLAAIAGGKVGQRYHRRVDDAVLASGPEGDGYPPAA